MRQCDHGVELPGNGAFASQRKRVAQYRQGLLDAPGKTLKSFHPPAPPGQALRIVYGGSKNLVPMPGQEGAQQQKGTDAPAAEFEVNQVVVVQMNGFSKVLEFCCGLGPLAAGDEGVDGNPLFFQLGTEEIGVVGDPGGFGRQGAEEGDTHGKSSVSGGHVPRRAGGASRRRQRIWQPSSGTRTPGNRPSRGMSPRQRRQWLAKGVGRRGGP